MPSCLIELGFITTPDEENLLNDESRIDDIAKAIYEGFAKYKNKYDKRVTIPYRSQASEGNGIPSIVPDSYKRPERKSTPMRKQVVETAPARKQKVDTAPARKQTVAPVKKQTPASVKSDAPIFKVQILVSSRVLRKGDAHFKGEENYDSYQESGMVKYTIGASANYNEIYQLRKSLLDKFPEAFIIAFKNGKKYDVNQAIREFKQNKNR